MRTGITVHLSPIDRKRLRAIIDDRNSSQKHVWLARIVLGTADGLGTVEIMRTAGVSKTAVWRWPKCGCSSLLHLWVLRWARACIVLAFWNPRWLLR